MAKDDKKAAPEGVKPVEPEEVKPAEPAAPADPAVDMELVKALAEKMAREIVKAKEKEEAEANITKDEAREAYLRELVPYNFPYIPGEPEDITVKVAGEPLYRLMCGEDVEIPRYVAMLLDNKRKMLARARRYERAHNRRDERHN